MNAPQHKESDGETHGKLSLEEMFEQMDATDREILVLRHFEQLELAEIAAVVEMTYDAVASRYRRSLKKLGIVLNMTQP